jgi:hypothetical protein
LLAVSDNHIARVFPLIITMEALITRDELIGEGQTRCEPTLLQPENGIRQK